MSRPFPSPDYAGRLIDGRFTLLRALGGTESSSVYLAEFGEEPKRKVALKFIPADRADARSRIAQWERTTALSHPHLAGIFGHGRCEIDNNDLLYVANEYADEVLSEILPERALTPDETREMLGPIVDALSFLHGQNLVHGHLKPSNILVVDDLLKLAADGIAAKGEMAEGPPSPYDAPEIASEKMAPAADVWSLGVVLVEALTRQAPDWSQGKDGEPEIPVSIPQPFFDIARECLRVDPARRLTLSGIKAILQPAKATTPEESGILAQAAQAAAEKTPALAAEPAAEKTSGQDSGRYSGEHSGQHSVQAAALAGERNPAQAAAPVAEKTRKPTFKSNVQAFVGTLIVLGVALFVMRASSHRPAPAPPAQPAVAPPIVAQPKPATPAAGIANGQVIKGEVASRAIPEIPEKIAGSIRGHIKVSIRVQVDENGNVVQASVDSRGPSHYFAEQALQAARKWKFTPAWIGGRTVASVWLLHFQFGATQTEANAQEQSPQ